MISDVSRYKYCQSWYDADRNVFLDARRAFRFQSLPDNVSYLTKVGETLFTIAGRHFAPLERAAGLWWVIADFQPNPIHDPTIVLEPGTVLVLPSVATLYREIFSSARKDESRV